MRRLLLAGMLLLAPVAAQAKLPADPLASPMWQRLGGTLFGDDTVRFDDRVKVVFPGIAEDQHSFPVSVDARGIKGVRRIILFADLNPIPLAVDFTPEGAQPFLATRIKLDQRTPVRAAVQLEDGSWLVSGGWIDAAGGGCSAPPASRVKGDWAEHLGEVRGVALRGGDGTHVRLAFRHPMDTGFVANIPTYNLQDVALTGAGGKHYGTMRIEASVAEDPSITVITDAAVGEDIVLRGSDTNGIRYDGSIAVRAAPADAAVAAR
ncbi:quinoprotein dehydrogenase-associated SoxYZ-like carrier [Sphingomonas sp. CA1-15]|uniref:Quinoprotein dehydrogenase-associated SoxYZ-like carrier n=2 Tax=Sphingomonas immobilis TaxID=3063997 RepID=A0ABT9A251_9SPHN|nr:quinoprotein dehydrogenase-associated SoxYZ-like carrier [Sphingomonas sp. CA1-15]MDO7843901.1 quinoprotein dehydrogenase-associated SoxYZ-like carrier [Sphingomonas sp. CA1-15]